MGCRQRKNVPHMHKLIQVRGWAMRTRSAGPRHALHSRDQNMIAREQAQGVTMVEDDRFAVLQLKLPQAASASGSGGATACCLEGINLSSVLKASKLSRLPKKSDAILVKMWLDMS